MGRGLISPMPKEHNTQNSSKTKNTCTNCGAQYVLNTPSLDPCLLTSTFLFCTTFRTFPLLLLFSKPPALSFTLAALTIIACLISSAITRDRERSRRAAAFLREVTVLSRAVRKQVRETWGHETTSDLYKDSITINNSLQPPDKKCLKFPIQQHIMATELVKTELPGLSMAVSP